MNTDLKLFLRAVRQEPSVPFATMMSFFAIALAIHEYPARGWASAGLVLLGLAWWVPVLWSAWRTRDWQAVASFQDRVYPWMQKCFGPKVSADRKERSDRFLEEALELTQACGYSAHEAHMLVDYVFGRPVGEKSQEVGGVMVTLAALCLAHDGLDMHDAGEVELARINQPEMVVKIRAKQAAKPRHSPLPEAATAEAAGKAPASVPSDWDGLVARIQHALQNARLASSLLMEAHKNKRESWCGYYDDALVHADIAVQDLEALSKRAALAAQPRSTT